MRNENEVLFHRLVTEYVAETASILRNPPSAAVEHRVGAPPRGVYLSVNHPEDVETALRNTGVQAADVDLLVVTDSVGSLDHGIHGVDRIHAAAGGLALYTAAAGIRPQRALPVLLDVGTDDVRRLADPRYVGARHAVVRDDRHDQLIDAFVTAASKLWPGAVLSCEGFDGAVAERVLSRFAGHTCLYDDGLQGRAAAALSATLSAARVTGSRLRDQSVLVHGVGPLAQRIVHVLREEMTHEGLGSGAAAAHVRLTGPNGLADDVDCFSPTVLIGVSGQMGAFTESVITRLADRHQRPVILPLSHPDSAEATAADLIRWTDGRALVATGGWSAPVTHRRRTMTVAYADTALVSPGICLGATVAQATRITDDMIAAAARAVAELATPESPVLPPATELRRVSATVAVAVARAAERAGVAQAELPDVIQQVHQAMWRPHYPEIEAFND